MDVEYSRKSGQIPAFGDWENANEMPITQYFECARQAGLARCSCSGECGGSFMNNAAAWDGGGGDAACLEKPLPRRVYVVPQRKTNKGFSHSKDQTKQCKVANSIGRPRNRSSAQNQYPKQSRKFGDNVFQKSSVTIKPVDEDLYKIPHELVKKSKRKKMLRFISKCMSPLCAA